MPGHGPSCSPCKEWHGAEPPQMEEQPVALAIYILSPNSWVASLA